MLKERLNLSLNEEAAKALTDLADRLKMSRTAIIEAVLVEAARRENVAENNQRLRRGLHLKTDTSSAEFKEWESEQARAGLKAITGALPEFPDIGPSVESGRGKASVEMRPLERGRVEPLTKPGKR